MTWRPGRSAIREAFAAFTGRRPCSRRAGTDGRNGRKTVGGLRARRAILVENELEPASEGAALPFQAPASSDQHDQDCEQQGGESDNQARYLAVELPVKMLAALYYMVETVDCRPGRQSA